MFSVIVNFLRCHRMVDTTFIRVPMFVTISQVGFRASVTRVFFYRPTNFPSVLSVALHATFSNRRRSFLGTKIYGSFRLVLSFLGDRFLAVGIIMTIGSTMRAMVLTMIYGVGQYRRVRHVSRVLTYLSLYALYRTLRGQLYN